MATTAWTVPIDGEINGTTYIKDTDDKLNNMTDDLVEWVNSTGAWAGIGLSADMVDVTTAQTIAGVKTFTDVAVVDITGDVTGDVTGNADTSTTLVNLTSTVTELNKLDGYTGGVTELNYLDTLHATGVTNTEFDYLDGVTSNIQTQFSGLATLSGSNSNGSFVRLYDGTLITYGTVTSTTTVAQSNMYGSTSGTTYYSNKTISFPYTYYAAPSVSLSVSGSAVITPQTATPTTSSILIYPQSRSDNTLVTIRWIAVGRWKA